MATEISPESTPIFLIYEYLAKFYRKSPTILNEHETYKKLAKILFSELFYKSFIERTNAIS